ncbi:MAG: NmrA family NAD(P)-binding protein [Ignavibacteriaceae bacterium]
MFKGDLKNKDSLNNIFNNTSGLFFALPLSKDSIGYGKTLLNVAKESNLEHIIYCSVGGMDRYLKVDHFRYKKEIEDYLQNLDKHYTIIHPAGYMNKFAHPKSIKFITGLLKLYLPESKTFQLIALKDIGLLQN